MDEFDLLRSLGLRDVSATHFVEILARLCVAAALGACVSYRPWRLLIPRAPKVPLKTAQSQMLIAVAGVLMVAVIGDSTARAFGLVGLGAFIRFRSGIKDPRDAAVMFVMIGIGMGCGLGMAPLALVATVFASAVLTVLDATGRGRPERARVAIGVEDPQAALPALRAALPRLRVVDVPARGAEKAKLVVEFDTTGDVDAAALRETIEKAGVAGVRSVGIEED